MGGKEGGRSGFPLSAWHYTLPASQTLLWRMLLRDVIPSHLHLAPLHELEIPYIPIRFGLKEHNVFPIDKRKIVFWGVHLELVKVVRADIGSDCLIIEKLIIYITPDTKQNLLMKINFWYVVRAHKLTFISIKLNIANLFLAS